MPDTLSIEELPDLESKEVQNAAIKIQSVYKGFSQRKKNIAHDTVRQVMVVQNAKQKFKDDLPDLMSQDVKDATVKIQSVFRGYQARKKGTIHTGQKVRCQMKTIETDADSFDHDDMPNLESKEVQEAAMKIQSMYLGDMSWLTHQ